MGRLVQFPGAATAKALADVIGKPGLLTVEGMRVGVQTRGSRLVVTTCWRSRPTASAARGSAVSA